MKRLNLSKVLENVMEFINGPISSIISSYKGLESLVVGSKISSSLDRYARISSLCIFLAMVGTGIASLILMYRYVEDIIISIATCILVSICVAFPLSLAIAIAIPSFAYSNRRSLLEAKFPLLAMTLSLLLASGVGISKAFNELEKRFIEELKYFDLEIQMVNSLIRIGIPIDEALHRVSSITPSLSVRELFTGLASVARVGGDPATIVSSIMANYIVRYGILVEKTVNDIGIIMEVYLAFALLIPVILGSVAVLFLLHPIPILSFEAIMFFTIFILIPIVSITILIIVDTMVSKLRV